MPLEVFAGFSCPAGALVLFSLLPRASGFAFGDGVTSVPVANGQSPFGLQAYGFI